MFQPVHSQHVSGSSKVHFGLFRPIVKIESFLAVQTAIKLSRIHLICRFLFCFRLAGWRPAFLQIPLDSWFFSALPGL